MSILTDAENIINGDRREAYGDPREMEGRIAGLWSAYLGVDLVAADVSNMMILLKVSRAKGQVDRGMFHRDSYVDIAGYAGLAEKLHDADEADQRGTFTFNLGAMPSQIVQILTSPNPFVPVPIELDEPLADWERELLGLPPVALLARVWDSLTAVPNGLRVLDREGDEWIGDDWMTPDSGVDTYGPFTEVKETA